jgi:hypothetical protein
MESKNRTLPRVSTISLAQPGTGAPMWRRVEIFAATPPLLDLWMAMDNSLTDVLRTLREHEGDLRRLGVEHAAVFGSVAR